MKLTVFLFISFFTLTPFSYGNSPACRQVFSSSSTVQINDLSRELPKNFSIQDLLKKNADLFLYPDFRDSESMELFTDANPLMGFISIGDRVLLATRNPKIIEGFQQNPLTGEDAFGDKELEAKKIKELPGYTVFDISTASYLPEVTRKMHGLSAWDEGPNCWNLCQIYKGWARTAYATNDYEFGLWVDGPFAKRAQSATPFLFSPKMGDVIVIRNRGFKSGQYREVHGAIALSEDLVFTKNGTDFSAPYQISTVSDMLKVYLPRMGNSIEYREIATFDEVWSEWSPKVSAELKAYVERWMSFEQEHGELFLTSKKSQSSEDKQEAHEKVDKTLRDLRKEIQPILKDRLAAYENRELSELEKVEKFFWSLLKARSESSYF